MGIEIERKFLIDFKKIDLYDKKIEIKQGYILNSPEKVVRIRVADKDAFLTIKGKNEGASRPEFEYEIPYDNAIELLKFTDDRIIEKTRYILKINNDIWEIDKFHGKNEGLVVAEIEIPSEDYDIELPEWILKEVTSDTKYYNNNLIIHPYSTWDNV